MDFLKHFVFDEIFVRDLYYLYNICVIICLSYMKYVNIKVEWPIVLKCTCKHDKMIKISYVELFLMIYILNSNPDKVKLN